MRPAGTAPLVPDFSVYELRDFSDVWGDSFRKAAKFCVCSKQAAAELTIAWGRFLRGGCALYIHHGVVFRLSVGFCSSGLWGGWGCARFVPLGVCFSVFAEKAKDRVKTGDAAAIL